MTSLMNTTTVTNLMNTTNTLVITSHNRRQSNSLLMRPPLWPRLSCTHAGHGAPEAKAELELREMQALKEGLCIQQSSFRRSFFFFFLLRQRDPTRSCFLKPTYRSYTHRRRRIWLRGRAHLQGLCCSSPLGLRSICCNVLFIIY